VNSSQYATPASVALPSDTTGSLTDQSCLGRFAGMTGSVLAFCIHRESRLLAVSWRRPVSKTTCRALNRICAGHARQHLLLKRIEKGS
jgi:hypothetical protein